MTVLPESMTGMARAVALITVHLPDEPDDDLLLQLLAEVPEEEMVYVVLALLPMLREALGVAQVLADSINGPPTETVAELYLALLGQRAAEMQ